MPASSTRLPVPSSAVEGGAAAHSLADGPRSEIGGQGAEELDHAGTGTTVPGISRGHEPPAPHRPAPFEPDHIHGVRQKRGPLLDRREGSTGALDQRGVRHDRLVGVLHVDQDEILARRQLGEETGDPGRTFRGTEHADHERPGVHSSSPTQAGTKT